ncbi:hypothetical protein Tco_0311338, partial [Tanacetum coccineum]
MGTTSVAGNLGSKVKNIDGKMNGTDDKLRKPVRHVQREANIADPVMLKAMMKL